MSVQERQAESGAVTVGLWPGIRQKDRVWRKCINRLIWLLIGQRGKVLWRVRFASPNPSGWRD